MTGLSGGSQPRDGGHSRRSRPTPLRRAPSTQHPATASARGLRTAGHPGAGPAAAALDLSLSPEPPRSHTRGQCSEPHWTEGDTLRPAGRLTPPTTWVSPRGPHPFPPGAGPFLTPALCALCRVHCPATGHPDSASRVAARVQPALGLPPSGRPQVSDWPASTVP